MPNTLAHLGLQALATRALVAAPEARWVFLGCVIPDLPWIVRRTLVVLVPGVDLIVLRVWAIAQSSLALSLLLCAAFASISRAPPRVFAILSLNALLHLGLDALQTKWGNGVHLLAPLSWQMLSLELFWPESAITLALSVGGLAYAGAVLWRGVRMPTVLRLDRPARLGLAAGLVLAWLGLPWVLRDAVLASDSHSLGTISSGAARAGRPIAVDRATYTHDLPGAGLELPSGERVAVRGLVPDASGQVSVHGRFDDPDTLVIEKLHVHARGLRDLGSYVGLALVALVWLLPLRRARPGDPGG